MNGPLFQVAINTSLVLGMFQKLAGDFELNNVFDEATL